jgi:hypothetical protein
MTTTTHILATTIAVISGTGAGADAAASPPPVPVVRVENRFELTVPAAYEKVAPLFGAWAERAWAGPTGQPEFLYPVPPRDEPGVVFQVTHGHARATWVNTAFDLAAGFVQYVYVVPGVQAVVIDIHLARDGVSATHARVSYRRTALDPVQNVHVTELGVHDRQAGPEWQAALTAAVLEPPR